MPISIFCMMGSYPFYYEKRARIHPTVCTTSNSFISLMQIQGWCQAFLHSRQTNFKQPLAGRRAEKWGVERWWGGPVKLLEDLFTPSPCLLPLLMPAAKCLNLHCWNVLGITSNNEGGLSSSSGKKGSGAHHLL